MYSQELTGLPTRWYCEFYIHAGIWPDDISITNNISADDGGSKDKAKKKKNGKKKMKNGDSSMVEMKNHNNGLEPGGESSVENKENNDPAVLELTEQTELNNTQS